MFNNLLLESYGREALGFEELVNDDQISAIRDKIKIEFQQ